MILVKNIYYMLSYVFDALKVINKGKVRFSFSGEMKPFIVQSVEDNSVLQLILPLRTYV